MASAGDEDPFLQVQADVISTLATTRPLFSSYLRIRSLATSPTSPELAQARAELESTLQDLSTDLRDLVESVQAIEHDPYRYGIELDEVERRRKLVAEVGGEVEDMRGELLKTVFGARKGKAAMNGDLPHPEDFASLQSPDGDGDGYEEWEQQKQVEMMHEQDQALDGVFKTVGNLRQQADDMGRELEDQAEMLEEVDTLADRVGGKLQNGVKKVGYIIKKNEGMLFHDCDGPRLLIYSRFCRHRLELLHCDIDLRPDTTPYPCHRSLRATRYDTTGILPSRHLINVLGWLLRNHLLSRQDMESCECP